MRSADPKVRELVAALATLELAPAPRAEFRNELRAQLVAVTPRLVAEGMPEPAPARRETRQAVAAGSGFFAKLRPAHFARPFALVGACLALFGFLLGGAVMFSKNALPGDSLYNVKRASENARLSLTSGVDRAKMYLTFATTRVQEVGALLGHPSSLDAVGGTNSASGINPHTASLVASTLGSQDGDVIDASQILGRAAVSQHSAAPLQVMTSWAPGQIASLQAIADRIPAGALHDRALTSLHLVEGALNRANSLAPVVGCSCMSTARSDQFGPVPCSASACTTPSTTGNPTGTPTLPPATTPSTGGSTHSAKPTGGHTAEPTNPTSPGAGSGSSTPTPPLGGISLPITAPTLPLPTTGAGLPTLLPKGPTPCSTGLLGSVGGLLGVCTSSTP
jgi:hypothetical protein